MGEKKQLRGGALPQSTFEDVVMSIIERQTKKPEGPRKEIQKN